MPTEAATGTPFRLGDKVRLRADPGRRGAITDGPRPTAAGPEFEVLLDGSEAWFHASQLEKQPVSFWRWARSKDELLRTLALAKLGHPITDGLYAYGASRTEFQAYQFRPALKFLRNDGKSLLIADEVGLGKTIEAAIIYLELKARLDISQVLVVCPSRLTEKWRDELRLRFEETFEVWSSESIRRFFDDVRRVGQSRPYRAIVSIELLRTRDFAERWSELGIPIDLLIVDEAHYLRNPDTKTHRLGVTLANAADALLFLSATPLQMGNRDLFTLLNLLAPEEFNSLDLFELQVQPNQHINQAIRLIAARQPRQAAEALRRVEETGMRSRFRANPFYRDIVATLERRGVAIPDREAVAIQRELMELNTLSSVFTRTRKREMTDAAHRAASTIKVTLSPEERQVYDRVLAQTKAGLRSARSGAPAFAAVMPERQAASCIAVARARLGRGAGSSDPASLGIERSQFDLLDESEVASEAKSVGRSDGSGADPDTKFGQFARVLDEAVYANPSGKALVFSFFRGTLDYLYGRLRDLGRSVGVIHGGIPVAERRRIIERFREDPQQRVLLSSEVGAEGLDFQFCDVLVNYDLPWNPMQVEQRIGRLDRFGQRAERIRIFNFVIDDTIETRIFQRLYERIGIFERSIGDLESILGEVIVQLSRDVMQADLTPEEQERRALAAADMIYRRQLEQEVLEQHKDALLGQGRILDQQIENAIDSGRYVSPGEVQSLVVPFVQQRFERSRVVLDREEPCATIEMDIALREAIWRCIERDKLHPVLSPQLQTALGGGPKLAFTFDAELARKRPNLDFVTVRHPLTVLARKHWERDHGPAVPAGAITMPGAPGEQGSGSFSVFLMETRAARSEVSLLPVVVLDDGRFAQHASDLLLRALQVSDFVMVNDEDRRAVERALPLAEAHAATRRDERTREARRRNDAILSARRDALRQSFEARIERTTAQRNAARDERIIRMKDGEIRRLRARWAAKLEDLTKGDHVSVSSRLLIGGRVHLTSPDA